MNPAQLLDILERITALFEHSLTISPINAMATPQVMALRRAVDQFKTPAKGGSD